MKRLLRVSILSTVIALVTLRSSAYAASSNASTTPAIGILTSKTTVAKMPSNLMPAGITFVNSDIGYVSGDTVKGNSSTGCVYKTIDGGHTWKQILQKGTAVSIVAVFGHDIWIDVTDHQNGGLYFSKDDGRTFTDINSVYLGEIDFTSRNVGWAVSEKRYPKAVIMKTMDGGKHWVQVHLPNLQSGGGAVVGFADPKNGWLLEDSQPGAGNQGKALLRTTNGGRTWSVTSNVQIGENSKDNQLGSGGYADGIDVVPSHPSYAYIWESRGPLLYTSDGGKFWHASSVTKPEAIEARGVSMQTLKDGFALLQDMSNDDFILEHTPNGGSSWQVVYKWSYS